MLAVHDATELIESIWLKLGCEVQLPDNWGDFFEHKGILPCEYDDRRTYARLHFRGKAIVKHDNAFFAVYTRDVSRGGLAFYHKQQMLPGQRARIWLVNGLSHDIEIARCRLRHELCYECGARFVSGTS
jgi:hypothetical protein